MCGITGYISFNKNSDNTSLKKMVQALHHRGPDSSGEKLYYDDNFILGLGHARLSIIELSVLGSQPMNYKNYWITFNGEIYNHESIREKLQELGHDFISHSDTEVILHAFDQWGVEAVHQFIGMFAFTIYDEVKKKLFLFRDRAGVKPLYYYWDSNVFIFGSELKAIYSNPDFRININFSALPYYFQYGYIPAPLSIYENTFKLEPGYYLEFDIQTKQLKKECYWDVLQFYNQPKSKLNEDEIISQLKPLMLDAFKLRMVSDVPVGVFLSGGYDSTAVAALLQSSMTNKLKTFTIGFENDDYNEAEQAKEIAGYLGTEHYEFYCTETEAQKIIPELPHWYDEPFADSSAIPTILVSKMAREHVTVALSADGGDEIFAGYKHYANVIGNLKKLNQLPSFLHKPLGIGLSAFLTTVDPLIKSYKLKYKLAAIQDNLIHTPSSKRISYWMLNEMREKDLQRLLLKSYKKADTTFDAKINNEFNDDINQLIAADYKTYMVDDILTKVDRATMSVSLEGREPLLDHRIIEFVATLPSEYKYKEGTQKYLLKKIVHDFVPKEMMNRPKKGFGVPVKMWMRNDLKYLIKEYLDYDLIKAQGILNVNMVKERVSLYMSGNDSHWEFVWRVLNFQMWYKKWIN